MLEKGKFLRKLLCLWGWHRWTKHDKQKEDRFYRLILPLLSIGVPILFLGLDLILPRLTLLPQLIFIFFFIIGFITLPKATHLAGGAFDGTCVFCHKHVMHLTEERNKKKDDEEYMAALTEVAKEAYENHNTAKEAYENNVGDVE